MCFCCLRIGGNLESDNLMVVRMANGLSVVEAI